MKFELFGRLKKKKPENVPPPSLPDINQEIPESVIKDMLNQGLTQGEIVNQLRNKGYTYSQINKALNEVVKKEAVREEEEKDVDFQQPQFPPEQKSQENETQIQQSVSPEEFSSYEEQPLVPENMEELIEVIVAEKLIDVEDNFEKVNKRISKIEKNLAQLRDDVNELKIRKDEDEKKFLGKIEELEQFMEASHGRIGGLERALKEVLPTLVENVRDLTTMMKEGRKE